MHFTFTSPLWVYIGKGAWYFVTLPKKQADEINFFREGKRRGWGSLRVRAQIGETSWNTSIFPDSKSSSYVLPIKAKIRKKESIGAEDQVTVILKILQ